MGSGGFGVTLSVECRIHSSIHFGTRLIDAVKALVSATRSEESFDGTII